MAFHIIPLLKCLKSFSYDSHSSYHNHMALHDPAISYFSALITSSSPLSHTALAMWPSFFLKHGRHACATGRLHLPFSLLGIFCPWYPQGSLSCFLQVTTQMSPSRWGFHWPSYLQYILQGYLVFALGFFVGFFGGCCYWCCRYHALEYKLYRDNVSYHYQSVLTSWYKPIPAHHSSWLSVVRMRGNYFCPKALSHHWKFHYWKCLWNKNIVLSFFLNTDIPGKRKYIELN